MYCVGIVCHSLTYDNNTHDKDNNSLRVPEAWLITAVAESKSKWWQETLTLRVETEWLYKKKLLLQEVGMFVPFFNQHQIGGGGTCMNIQPCIKKKKRDIYSQKVNNSVLFALTYMMVPTCWMDIFFVSNGRCSSALIWFSGYNYWDMLVSSEYVFSLSYYLLEQEAPNSDILRLCKWWKWSVKQALII